MIESLNIINNFKRVILPIHPRTRKIIKNENILVNFDLVDPVGYLEMIWLISSSKMIITDSGGLQKEAYFFKKFCLTLRDETEWVELVESGNNILVGTNKNSILEAFNKKPVFQKNNKMIYGKGDTSKKIIKALQNFPSDI